MIINNFLYGRKYRILVSNPQGEAWEVSNLRCSFQVHKLATEPCNTAEVTIYNLTRDTETHIIAEGSRIIIEAGYSGYTEVAGDDPDTKTVSPKQYGIIFDGDIIQAFRGRENNVDYTLTIVAVDGERSLINNYINMTREKGLTPQRIVEEVSKSAMNNTDIAYISPELDTKKLPRGKVFFGAPKKYFKSVARDQVASYWVDDGKLYLVKYNDIPKDEALVITPENGLIGVPTQTQNGINLKVLLNPNIKLRSIIKLDNSMIRSMKAQIGSPYISNLDKDGQYQVVGLDYTGDTRGNEWYVDLVCTGINGKYSLLLNTPATNPY